MATIKVRTGSKKEGNQKEAQFDYPIPATIEDAIREYTAEVTYDEFVVGITLSLQAPARRALVSAPVGSDYNQVVSDAMREWKPGVKMARKARAQVDPLVALEAAWPTLSPERKLEIAAKFGMTLGTPSTPSAPSGDNGSTAFPSDETVESVEMAAGRRRR